MHPRTHGLRAPAAGPQPRSAASSHHTLTQAAPSARHPLPHAALGSGHCMGQQRPEQGGCSMRRPGPGAGCSEERVGGYQGGHLSTSVSPPLAPLPLKNKTPDPITEHTKPIATQPPTTFLYSVSHSPPHTLWSSHPAVPFPLLCTHCSSA